MGIRVQMHSPLSPVNVFREKHVLRLPIDQMLIAAGKMCGVVENIAQSLVRVTTAKKMQL